MPVDEAPEGPGPALTRRRFLAWSAASAVLAACELAGPTDRPSRVPEPAPTTGPTPGGSSGTPIPTPSRSAAAPATPGASQTPSPLSGRTLYRNGALTDARSDRLRIGVSILVEDGTIRWIRPSDDEGDRGPRSGLEVVDAGGATFVPGMVDAHSHVTLPGGAHWIARADDDPAVLLDVAERNGRLMTGAGIRWARDVGAPRVEDPTTGTRRALSLTVRDRWWGRAGFPYLRAAGTWLTRRGSLSSDTHAIQVDNADELLDRANGQLDEGADLVKLYLSGPGSESSPFTASEVRRVVDAVHARGAKVTAHATRIAGARAGVRGRVDAIEHGSELDAALCREMAEHGTFLVTTIALFRSWQTFARTTDQIAFTGAAGRRVIGDRLERARASARLARNAGVKIAAGTDAGGGSLRANQLAWEVEQLVTAGLEPWQALAAATWRGGELLGEPEAGVIREGGPADFFLVHGDPLSEPRALWRVWRVAWAE